MVAEIVNMIKLGKHVNIVNILGTCTHGKRLLLIMEFAEHGSLLLYLRQRRSAYRATWFKAKMDPREEYTILDMVMAAFQISKGMEFLAFRKVHSFYS